MKIFAVTLHDVRLPLRRPFRTATGTLQHRRVVVVELTGDRYTGWGECDAFETPHYTGETIDQAWDALVGLVPRLEGTSVDHPASLADLLVSLAPDRPMVRAAVEMAGWDLAAREAGLPLARLLGPARRRIPVGAVIGLDEPELMAAAAVEAFDQGSRQVKLKIEPDRASAILRAVRSAVGSERLAVDANQSYPSVEAVQDLDGFGLAYIEQPMRGIESHTEVRRRLATPVALDESVGSIAEARRAVELGATDIVNVKPSRLGGHREAVALHRFAASAGLDLFVGGMLETGIGRAHAVSLASLPGFAIPTDLGPSRRYFDRDLIDPPWKLHDGQLVVPESPGIGVTVDEEQLRRHTIRTSRNNPPSRGL